MLPVIDAITITHRTYPQTITNSRTNRIAAEISFNISATSKSLWPHYYINYSQIMWSHYKYSTHHIALLMAFQNLVIFSTSHQNTVIYSVLNMQRLAARSWCNRDLKSERTTSKRILESRYNLDYVILLYPIIYILFEYQLFSIISEKGLYK